MEEIIDINSSMSCDRAKTHTLVELSDIVMEYNCVCHSVVEAISKWLKQNIDAKESLVTKLREIQYGDEWEYRYFVSEVVDYTNINRIVCDIKLLSLSAHINALIYFGSQYTIYAKKLINAFVGKKSYNDVVDIVCSSDAKRLIELYDYIKKEF